MSTLLKRIIRIGAFSIGAGIAGLGAGSAIGLSVAQSAAMGSLTGILGIVGALAFIYAGKGTVSNDDFDVTIKSAIETVRAKEKDER